MTHRQKKIKIETTDQSITSFGGLALFFKAIENSSFFSDLENLLPKQEKGIGPIGTIRSLLMLILSGGNSVSDIDLLSNDNGFLHALGLASLPKQNTLSTNVKKYRDLKDKISQYLLQVAISYYKEKKITEVTLDIDSSLIGNKKQDANYCYEKYKAYNPMFIVDEQNSLVLTGKMRNGNASPQSDIFEMVRDIHKEFKKHGISVSFRIDSAGFQVKIFELFDTNDIKYSITGDMSGSRQKYFNEIENSKWVKLKEEKKEACIAYDSIANAEKRISIKVVVFRSEKEQYDLIEGRYNYHYFATNLDMELLDLIKFHRMRGNAENIFKDMKQEYMLSKLPFNEIESNGLFMQVIIAAYNLFKIFKGVLLKAEWRKHTLRVVRHRLFRCSAIIRNQARTLKMVICDINPYKDDLISLSLMSGYSKRLIGT